MSDTRRPLKVFLCHASQDKPVVRELSQRLGAEGWIDPWLDEKKLLPGQDWRLKIEEAVETSDIVIICLSDNSVTKEGYVQKELRYAREIALEKLDESIFLIPLRLDDCLVPRGLRFYQWVDYFGEEKDKAYSALIESLELRHQQKIMLEEQERARKEKLELEIAERVARVKEEREAAEKLAQEGVARERATKDSKEKARAKPGKHKEEESAEQISKGNAAKGTVTCTEEWENSKKPKPFAVGLKPVEERSIGKTSQVEPRATSGKSLRLNSISQFTFWAMGFVVVIFVIGMLALSEWNKFPTFALTLTTTSLSELDAALTSSPGMPSKTPSQELIPTASPSQLPSAKGSGKIAFSSNREGNTDIYVMDPDGSNQMRLTNDPGADVSPQWSPDGTKIAFLSEREGVKGLYVMNVDGSNQKELVNELLYGPGTFAWSPEGNKLLYTYYDGNVALATIAVDDVGTTDVETVKMGESSSLWYPIWSPDGSKIAFSRERVGLFLIDADGKNETKVFDLSVCKYSTGNCLAESVSWSSDGSKLTFVFDTTGYVNSELFLIHLTTMQSVQLTDDQNRDDSPIFSPDDTQIAFVSSRQGGTNEIFIMNDDGSEMKKITSFLDRRVNLRLLEWLPGNILIFELSGRNDQGDYITQFNKINLANGQIEHLSGELKGSGYVLAP